MTFSEGVNSCKKVLERADATSTSDICMGVAFTDIFVKGVLTKINMRFYQTVQNENFCGRWHIHFQSLSDKI